MSRTLTSEYEGIHVENQHYKNLGQKAEDRTRASDNTVRSFIQKYNI